MKKEFIKTDSNLMKLFIARSIDIIFKKKIN